MGSSKRVLIVTTDDDIQRLKEPVGLTTPVLSDNGTKPVWIEAPSGGGGVSDHGALTGLSDDDHPQYATSNHSHGGGGGPEPFVSIAKWGTD
jgi:hypothetical protein